MHVTGLQHPVRIGAHGDVVDAARRYVVEAVIDAGRNDDDVAGATLRRCAGLLNVPWLLGPTTVRISFPAGPPPHRTRAP